MTLLVTVEVLFSTVVYKFRECWNAFVVT